MDWKLLAEFLIQIELDWTETIEIHSDRGDSDRILHMLQLRALFIFPMLSSFSEFNFFRSQIL